MKLEIRHTFETQLEKKPAQPSKNKLHSLKGQTNDPSFRMTTVRDTGGFLRAAWPEEGWESRLNEKTWWKHMDMCLCKNMRTKVEAQIGRC